MKNTRENNSLGPIIIIGVLFFIFGFITWLNATLIPYLKISCELSNMEAFFVTFAFYIAYFVTALPSSWILQKLGFKNGMSVGLITIGLGSLIFIPAAMTRIYGLFLTGLFIQGTGLSILQTASNPYVTILGPIESAAKRISIMGIANKVAGILSPIILGAVVLKDIDKLEAKLGVMDSLQRGLELDALAERVIIPYIIMAASLIVLAILVRFSALPEVEAGEDDAMDQKHADTQRSIFDFPYLWLGVLAIFLYVGVEVIAVDTLISYGSWLGFDLVEAKYFASFTLFAMVAGYVFGILAIPKIISQSKALMLFSIFGVLFTLAAILTEGYASVISIALLGFANSLMWPAIWPLSIDGLGKHTKLGSAFLIMGIAGGAVLPLLYGAFADIEAIGAQNAYLIMVPAYLYILFFATKGYSIGKRKHT